MTEEIKQLKEMMMQLMRRQPVQANPCKFCGAVDHKTDACPTIIEDNQEEVNALDGYQGYNNGPGQYQQRGQDRNHAGLSQPGPNKSLEDVVKELAASTQQLATTMHQYQAKTEGTLTELTKQMSEIATAVSKLKNEPGWLPSATIPNLRGNISTLAMVEDADEPLTPRPDATRADAKSKTKPSPSCSMQVIAPEGHMIDKNEPEGRLKARHEQNDPTTERTLATSHEALPEKSKDPGAFTVTCGIGETQIHHCLIDLGAAINVMPYSLYCSLGLGPLKPPRLLIELGDKSCIHPVGLLEDLTLHEGDLVVPADFYVLQMGDARNDDPPALILGRPFLFTTKTKIDMGIRLLSLAFGGKTSDFYVYGDADRPCTRKPPDIVNTLDFGALVPDRPEDTMHVNGPAAMAKMSSPPRRNVKANPPDRWRAEPSTPIHESFGQNEGAAEAKFDLTRPWDPNL
ncbi:unnamed protein product [Rhodiola kirilowii]